MVYSTNPNLYRQSSKAYVIKLLKIPTKDYLKQNYIAQNISPYIATKPKPRLIEAPSYSLKLIQRIIKKELSKIEVPYNIFSGIKGKSYIDNAKIHKDNQYLFKIDLSAFFPCITRETVYNFFYNDLMMTPDIAKIFTNLTTVDLTLCKIKDLESVEKFIQTKGIKTSNHLISGSPSSQILSYLVNHNMFDEIQYFCDCNGITMSVYVDDVTFSSRNRISHKQKEIIYNIISKYIYKLSRNKIKYYTSRCPKSVTGAIITPDGELRIPNHLSLKVVNELSYYKRNLNDTDSLKRLRGLVIASRQCEPKKFESISALICDSSKS